MEIFEYQNSPSRVFTSLTLNSGKYGLMSVQFPLFDAIPHFDPSAPTGQHSRKRSELSSVQRRGNWLKVCCRKRKKKIVKIVYLHKSIMT